MNKLRKAGTRINDWLMRDGMNWGDFHVIVAVLIITAAIVVCSLLGGCRTVTVNEVPGGGPVYVNQSYAPDISLSALNGLDTNAWKAIGQGAAAATIK